MPLSQKWDNKFIRVYNAMFLNFRPSLYLMVQTLKVQTKRFYHAVIPLNVENRIENSEDPNQTPPLGAVSSGSALFVQTVCPKI